jgi:TRAP-type uncharacterized transport system substrate-binding protein
MRSRRWIIPSAGLAIAAVIALAAPIGLAAGEGRPIWIASGPKGGTYRDFYARNLGKLLPGYAVLHRTTSGSRENLELLADGKADLAFAQADIYAAKLAANPERYGSIVILGKLSDECMYLAYRKKGVVTQLAQLAEPVGERPARIAVGPEQSGTSGTWTYLSKLDPKLGAATVFHDGDTLALNQLAVGAFDAVAWITDPINLQHKMLRAVMANDELGLMSLDDPTLEHTLADGTQIYWLAEIEFGSGWRTKKVTTVCTSALVFASRGAEEKLVETVADVVSLQRDRIVPPRASR